MAKIAKVQEVAVDRLVPYAKNAKRHSAKQVEKIAASIEEFGFLSPCLIDKDYNLIAGRQKAWAEKGALLVRGGTDRSTAPRLWNAQRALSPVRLPGSFRIEREIMRRLGGEGE